MSVRRAVAVGVCIGVLAVSGCDDGAVKGDALGSVALDVIQVPLGVQCIVIYVEGPTSPPPLRFAFPASPSMPPVFDLTGVVPGENTFTGEAYAQACNAITGASVPSYIAGPVTETVEAGVPLDVTLPFGPNTDVTVCADFPGDGGPNNCPPDAGLDAAAPSDAGVEDGGFPDAGPSDGGLDAGGEADAGLDAGENAGGDAGEDAGADAGEPDSGAVACEGDAVLADAVVDFGGNIARLVVCADDLGPAPGAQGTLFLGATAVSPEFRVAVDCVREQSPSVVVVSGVITAGAQAGAGFKIGLADLTDPEPGAPDATGPIETGPASPTLCNQSAVIGAGAVLAGDIDVNF